MSDHKLYIERRPENNDYAVRRANSDRASAIAPTQAEAISRAKEINPDAAIMIERVRTTKSGHPDQWRTE